jgi:hypothetical protein
VDTTAELTDWVGRWSAAYDHTRDARLGSLRGKARPTRTDREHLAEWIFRSHPTRLARTLEQLACNDQDWADTLAERAVACGDELGGWLIAQRIIGFGPELASAMLMANDPARFPVLHTRSWLSVCTLASAGLLPDGVVDRRRLVRSAELGTAGTWLAYLHACQGLRQLAGCPLRDVGRALWAANGHDAPAVAA